MPEKDDLILMISSIAKSLHNSGFFTEQPVQAIAQLVTVAIRYSLQDSEITETNFRDMVKYCPLARSIPDDTIAFLYKRLSKMPLSIKFSFVDPLYEPITDGILSLRSLEGRSWSAKVHCVISKDTLLIYENDKKHTNLGGILLDNIDFISPVMKGDKVASPTGFTIKSCMDDGFCFVNKGGKNSPVWFKAKTLEIIAKWKNAILAVSFKRMIENIVKKGNYSPCL